MSFVGSYRLIEGSLIRSSCRRLGISNGRSRSRPLRGWGAGLSAAALAALGPRPTELRNFLINRLPCTRGPLTTVVSVVRLLFYTHKDK